MKVWLFKNFIALFVLQEVFVVDYRYFNGNLIELINHFGITDVLFGHNVFVYNSGYTLSREKYLLNYSKYNPDNKPVKENDNNDTNKTNIKK